jgi:hypothetical protein
MPAGPNGHPAADTADVDPTAIAPLIEESQDLHADAMAATDQALAEVVELGQERRAAGGEDPDQTGAFAAANRVRLSTAFGGRLLAAAGAGTVLAGLVGSRAFAAQPTDVQILQTAASIEVLAVATYQTALTLPFIGGASANPVVSAFAKTTMSQHQQHQQAFNAAVTKLGGKAQNNPDPVLLKVVENAKPGLTSAGPVVALALELEQGAAETYVADMTALTDTNAKQTTASIMGVEAQHAAILLAVQALLNGGAPQLIALPPNTAALPSAAGSVGFPDAFYPTSQARPATEGALS